jgi:anti-sigma B factor antagonist
MVQHREQNGHPLKIFLLEIELKRCWCPLSQNLQEIATVQRKKNRNLAVGKFTSTTLELEFTKHKAHSQVKLTGELDAASARELDEYLLAVTTKENNSLLFDLEHVSYISSAGIGLFIFYSGELAKNDMKVVICNPTETVLEILNLLSLEKYIKIFRTSDEAVEYINE